MSFNPEMQQHADFCENPNINIAQYCRENGIKARVIYDIRHRRRKRLNVNTEPFFLPIEKSHVKDDPKRSDTITLKYRTFKLEIQENFSENLLEQIISFLENRHDSVSS